MTNNNVKNINNDDLYSEILLEKKFNKFSRILSLSVGIIGVIVLIGWIFDIAIFKSFIANTVSMKANSAICFMLIGFSLFFYQWRKIENSLSKIIIYTSSSIVFFISFITILEYILGYNFGIDEFFFREDVGAIFTFSPGRMALNTAFLFVLTSIVNIFIIFKNIIIQWCIQLFVIIIFLLSLISFITYIFSANQYIYNIGLSTTMSIHTVLVFILFSVSIILYSNVGISYILKSKYYGSWFFRKIILIIITIPLLLGWLKLQSVEHGIISDELSVSLVAFFNIFFSTLYILILSKYSNNKDIEREKYENKYHNLFINMTNGFALHEIITNNKYEPIDYKFIEINPAFEKMTGLSKDIIGKNVTEVIPGTERDKANWIGLYGEVALTGKNKSFENYSEALNKWFNVSAYSPKLGYLATVFEDITERKLSEDKINEEKELNRTIIDSIPGTFYILDAKGDYWRWNAYQRDEIVGKSEDQVSNTNAIDTIHPEDRVLIGTKIANVLKTGKTEIIEGRVLMRGGPMYKWFLMTGKRMMVRNEPYLIGTGIDITKQKENENKLLELDKLKDDFLSTTTHELITPLIPIKSQAQILIAGDYGKLNKEQTEAVKMIYRNEESLNILSREILDIAKIKSNKLKLNIDQYSIIEIITESINEMKIIAEQKNIKLILSPIPPIPPMKIDGVKIKQVIFNLLNNAIKFTNENGVINVEVIKNENEIKVIIKDNGIGIDGKDIEKLFIPFSQVYSSLDRKYRGTGLGLSISKWIIDAHKGKIWVESEGQGKGSLFIFTLPIVNYDLINK
jgi:PAS domain S-box-containing protein